MNVYLFAACPGQFLRIPPCAASAVAGRQIVAAAVAQDGGAVGAPSGISSVTTSTPLAVSSQSSLSAPRRSRRGRPSSRYSRVAARVEGVRSTAEVDLKPVAEIYRRLVGRRVDITEIARVETRRNLHAAARRECQVSEVPTHVALLDEAVMRGAGCRKASTLCWAFREKHGLKWT